MFGAKRLVGARRGEAELDAREEELVVLRQLPLLVSPCVRLVLRDPVPPDHELCDEGDEEAAISVVWRDTVAQSTSQKTRRPPARKARCISASAAGTSSTYSSTCTDSAASKLAFSTGSEVASAS